MRARSGLLLVAVCATLVLAPAAAAQSPSPTPNPGGVPTINSVEAILVNVSDDSRVLFTRNATTRRAPASLTKVITALVARDEYDTDEIVTTDDHVLQTYGSDLGLEPGMEVSVRDLYYALLLKSANDAAMALAAHHPAGYEHFIALMNQKARALGAYNSQFRNPHGLDQEGHYSCARDMAIFARELLRDPLLAGIVDTIEHTMIWKGRERLFGTHNKLMRSHPNVIGIKTGFTNQAGHALISGATTPVGTLVTVVMGSPNHYGETLALFDYGKAVGVPSAGGGPPEGFGSLPEPPAAPDIGLVSGLPLDTSDPRDDARWLFAMVALAVITAFTFATARRPSIAGPSRGEVWLAQIAADERRRRSANPYRGTHRTSR
jgi:D-alanyl-D-alanine carboxypeptidase